MRLSESEIVAGLHHENVFVRDIVLEYLKNCGRTQPDITRQVVAAVERFGWKDALKFYHHMEEFEPDESTLSWLIHEMERQDEGAPSKNARWHLASLVANAPVPVLQPHLESIFQLDHYDHIGRSPAVGIGGSTYLRSL